MRRSFCSVVLASILLALPHHAFGWASPGHMAVAYVAWKQLAPAEQARITALLHENPNYDNWRSSFVSAGVPESDLDRDIFMIAATWPDEIKQIYAKKNCGEKPPANVRGTETTGNYDDQLCHKYWHFVDVPTSPDHTAPHGIPTPNVALQIAFFASQLSDSTLSDRQKSYDLVWLEHLTGDIHQPLHATTRFLKGKTDIGGNNVLLLNGGSDKELHSFWDNIPTRTDGAHPDKMVAHAIAFIDPAIPFDFAGSTVDPAVYEPDGWESTAPSAWRDESFRLALKYAYVAPVKNGLGPYDLASGSSHYKTAAIAVAHLRVEMAGTRLAALIRANLH